MPFILAELFVNHLFLVTSQNEKTTLLGKTKQEYVKSLEMA